MDSGQGVGRTHGGAVRGSDRESTCPERRLAVLREFYGNKAVRKPTHDLGESGSLLTIEVDGGVRRHVGTYVGVGATSDCSVTTKTRTH